MSAQDKFRIGDKVILVDQGYAEVFFPNYKGGELSVVNIEEAGYGDNLLVTDAGISAFDFRFELASQLNVGSNTLNSGENSTSNDDSSERDSQPSLSNNAWFECGELPPVGTVCEHEPSGFSTEWFSVEVLAHKEFKGHDTGLLVVFATEDDVSFSSGECFRPIKSPEQIAKQEREAYCDRIYSVLCKAERKNNRSDMAESLYDAGLRFVGEGK